MEAVLGRRKETYIKVFERPNWPIRQNERLHFKPLPRLGKQQTQNK